MPFLAFASIVLVAARSLSERLRWSWEHHDTLWYLAIGVVLLFIAWLGHRREKNEVAVVLISIAGVCAIGAAIFMAVLGDWARRTGPVSARAVAREIRASHGGPISDVPLEGVCKTSYDCHRGSTCVQLDGDADKRCQVKCTKNDDCSAGATCEKVRGGRVCLK